MSDDLRTLGRAKNGLLEFFEKSLYIPKIYLDATWDGHPVDVLAIDRDGSGDVHVVVTYASAIPENKELQVQLLIEKLDPLLDRLASIPAQYKYIAAVDITQAGRDPLPGLPHPVLDKSFAADGLGKVGFLAVDSSVDKPHVRTVFKPERFRAFVSTIAGEYVQSHQADWEIRP